MVPYSYRIERELRLLRITVMGATTAAQRDELVRNVLSDPDYSFVDKTLIDRRASSSIASSSDIESAVSLLEGLSESIRPQRCATVGPDPAQYGTGRRVAAYVERLGLEFRPFLEMSAALEWLEVPPFAKDRTEP